MWGKTMTNAELMMVMATCTLLLIVIICLTGFFIIDAFKDTNKDISVIAPIKEKEKWYGFDSFVMQYDKGGFYSAYLLHEVLLNSTVKLSNGATVQYVSYLTAYENNVNVVPIWIKPPFSTIVKK
jgi:hypothetical protein